MDNLGIFFSEYLGFILLSAIIGYLLGSVNFSIIVTRIVTHSKVDIRTQGSGNAGFTNVLRSVGKVPAVITILGDYFKAFLAVWICGMIFKSAGANGEFILYGRYIAGLFCVIGHMFPLYFGFRGGKGVVTSAAMMSVYDIRIFAVVLCIFLIVFLLSRIISLGSIIASAGFVVTTFLVTYFLDYAGGGYSISYVAVSTVFAFLVAFLVVFRHRSNIKRILNGTEKKITVKKT